MTQEGGLEQLVRSVAVIMVLYKVTFQDTPAFNSLVESIKQIDGDLELDFYVFDNSPDTSYNDPEELERMNVKYFYDSSNPGLSKPSNDGADYAALNGKEWLLFTNPDTKYSKVYFAELFAAVFNNAKIALFAPVLISNSNIVSPARYRFNIGSSPRSVTQGINALKGKLVLYSGMFISVEAFNASGRFKNEIKLDFMDCFFSENYREKYRIFFLLNTSCEHDLSSRETNEQKVLNRFRYYCDGAKSFASNKINYGWLVLICLGRAIKLSLKFQNWNFLFVVLKTFV